MHFTRFYRIRIKNLIHAYTCLSVDAIWIVVNLLRSYFFYPGTMNSVADLLVPLVLILASGKRCAGDSTITLGENEILYYLYVITHAYCIILWLMYGNIINTYYSIYYVHRSVLNISMHVYTYRRSWGRGLAYVESISEIVLKKYLYIFSTWRIRLISTIIYLW